MKIASEERGGWTVLQLEEPRLDAQNSGELRNEILGLLKEEGQKIIMDLSEVSFIDSSGLGALLSGYKNATLTSGALVLAGLQPRVQSMFELTRLHRVFEIFPTVEDALGAA